MSKNNQDDSLPATNIEFNQKCLSSEDRRTELDKFARLYMAGLSRFLRTAKQLSIDNADELVNSFLQDRITDVLQKWDPKKPFRPWLRVCVVNYANDALRRWAREAGRRVEFHSDATPDTPINLINHDEIQSEACEIAAWLHAARETAIDKCQKLGPPYPRLFEIVIESPLWNGTAPISYEETGRQCNIQKDATHYIRRTRSIFLESLKRAILRVSDLNADEVDEEMERMRSLLFDPGRAIEVIHALRGPATEQEDMESLATLFLSEPFAANDPVESQKILDALLRTSLVDGTSEQTRLKIGDVIGNINSPFESWRKLKKLAKSLARETKEKTPREVVRIVYLASIAGGILQGHRSISRKSDPALRDDFRGALGHAWLTEEIRLLIREGLDSLSV